MSVIRRLFALEANSEVFFTIFKNTRNGLFFAVFYLSEVQDVFGFDVGCFQLSVQIGSKVFLDGFGQLFFDHKKSTFGICMTFFGSDCISTCSREHPLSLF